MTFSRQLLTLSLFVASSIGLVQCDVSSETNDYQVFTHIPGHLSGVDAQSSDLIAKVFSVFAPDEVKIIKSDQPIASNPLAIQRKLADLWKLGYEESKIETPEKFRTISKLVEKIKQNPQLARQHTGLSRFLSAFYKKHATGQEPNIKDFIQALNSNNTFVIDPQTMCQQIQWAYQLGSLHSLNQHVGTKYAMRSFQKATPAEVQTMIEKQKRQTQKHEFETADMAAVDSETLEGDAINDIVYSQIAA